MGESELNVKNPQKNQKKPKKNNNNNNNNNTRLGFLQRPCPEQLWGPPPPHSSYQTPSSSRPRPNTWTRDTTTEVRSGIVRFGKPAAAARYHGKNPLKKGQSQSPEPPRRMTAAQPRHRQAHTCRQHLADAERKSGNHVGGERRGEASRINNTKKEKKAGKKGSVPQLGSSLLSHA